MRITDARTGRRTEIRARRAGVLHVVVDVGEQDDDPSAPGDLRALLAGDVLARTCEIQGLQVVTELTVPDASAGQPQDLLQAAGRLGIHPPDRVSTRHRTGTTVPPEADLAITSRPRFQPDPPSTPLLVTGPVTGHLPDETPTLADASAEPSAPTAAHEHDPLALRLVLLDHALTDPIRLTADALADAAARLSRWRALVADLALTPSRPLDAGMVQAAFDGLHEDLDARVALRALQALEDVTALSTGSRFETFLRLDRILALELGRHIGRGL